MEAEACDHTAYTEEAGAGHNDAGTNANDDCSPFCTCACCQVSLQEPVFFAATEVPFSFLRIKNRTLHNDACFDFAAAIWQPPRFQHNIFFS
jgi:hypothetical protein